MIHHGYWYWLKARAFTPFFTTYCCCCRCCCYYLSNWLNYVVVICSFVCFLFFFLKRVSLFSSDWTGVHNLAQPGVTIPVIILPELLFLSSFWKFFNILFYLLNVYYIPTTVPPPIPFSPTFPQLTPPTPQKDKSSLEESTQPGTFNYSVKGEPSPTPTHIKAEQGIPPSHHMEWTSKSQLLHQE